MVGRRAALGVLGCALLVALPLAAAFACAYQATLTLSPSQAEPGAQVAGSGANFSNSHGGAPLAEPVVVRFGSAGPVVWSGRPAADGTISFSFTVPGVPPGEHLVVATQTNADGEPAPGTPAKALLTVTAPPTTTTTTPPPPTTTATSASSAPAVGVEQAAERAAPNSAPAVGAPVMAPTTTAPAVSLAPAGVSGAAPAVTATKKAQTTATAPTPATAPSVPSVAPAVPAPLPVAESDPSPAAAWEGRATPASATRSPAGTEDPRGEGVGGVLVAFGVVGTAGASALWWSALRRRART
ncbi:MAG: hypothetical protein ACRD0N_13760 [Acidimicrobiales bacterium]